MQKKTKNSRTNNNSKAVWWLLIALLLIAGGIGLWDYHNHHKSSSTTALDTSSKSTINYSPSTPSDNAANNARKNTSTPTTTLDNGAAISTVPLSITVTRAGVISSDLEIGTLVNGATTGSCTVYVSQNGQQTVTQTEQIQLQNNAYTCPVFNLPLSDFPNADNWNVSATVTSNGQTQTSQWQANPVNLSS
jgi:hypothetical protein